MYFFIDLQIPTTANQTPIAHTCMEEMTDEEKTESDMYDSEHEDSETSSYSSDEAISDDESVISEMEAFRIYKTNAQAKPHGDRMYWKGVFYASNISSSDRDFKTMHNSVRKDSQCVIPPTVQNLWGGGNIEVIEPTKEEKKVKKGYPDTT